jgi:hypothetical protein
MKFGACTGHWIEAKGDRQLSHVDYPMHVGSGPFWEHNVEKMKKYTTRYQVNHVRRKKYALLPKYLDDMHHHLITY